MASFVVIEFDRTKPTIEVHAPNYTTNEIVNVITIEASESLSSYQEFYIIDSQGGRHDYTFFQEAPNTYIGRIRFNTVPVGILNLYARVKDEVENISDLAVASIELKQDFQLLKMEVSHWTRDIKNSHRPHSSQLIADQRFAEIKTKHKIIRTNDSHRSMQIEEKHDDADLE